MTTFIKICLKVALIFSSFNLFAQNFNEQILGSTVLITYASNGVDTFGSGFTIFKETNKINKTGSHFLITNRHVIKDAGDVIKIRFFRKNYSENNARMELTIKLKDTNGKYLPKVRMNLKGADLVALEITDDYNNNQIQGNSLPYEWLATKDLMQNNDISIGDEIYMIGYPDEIYDRKNYSPIFRYGIIATLPTENYNFNNRLQNKYSFPNSIEGFLIDANVVPGSSGSLIILKQQIGKVSNGGINMGGTQPFILGIVDKSIPIEDDSPRNIQRIGLGVVYSAQAIKDTIDWGIRLAF